MRTERPLKRMPYAQATVILHDDGTIILRSYVTDVIVIDSQGWLYCTGLYSATTRKHISAFMREYTNYDYFLAKRLFTNNEMFNIYTGEVKKLC